MDKERYLIVYELCIEEKQTVTEAYLRFVSKERLERIRHLHFEEDQLCALYSELLLRYALNQTNKGTEDCSIAVMQQGKPYIPDHSEIHFNWSHSGRMICLAISSTEIGVDVEKIRDARLAVANRFFTAQECRLIQGAAPKAQGQIFTEIWTAKESFIKCTGEGLSRGLSTFGFVRQNGQYLLAEPEEAAGSYQFHHWTPEAGYQACICVCGNLMGQMTVRKIRITDLDTFYDRKIEEEQKSLNTKNF